MTGATVCFGVALAPAVLAVVFVVAVVREYGGPWWKDYSVYLVLVVPLVPALIGGWLVRRERHGKNR
jgi:hypothetical protein